MPFHQTLFDRISEGGNRLFGAPQGLLSPEEQAHMKQQGLLGLGSSLLRSSGPSRDPIGLGQAVGEAIPQGQAAAFQGLQTQDFLQQRQAAQQAAQAQAQALQTPAGQPLDLNQRIKALLQGGFLDAAVDVAGIAKNLGGEGGGRLITVDVGNRKILVDPTNGAQVAEFAVDATTDPKGFERIQSLAGQYSADTRDQFKIAQSFRTVTAAGADPSPAGDLAMIFAFMKMLDPGSVVREGEFATAANAANVPDRLRNVYNRAVDGTRMQPAQREDFLQQAANLARKTQEGVENIRQSFIKRGNKFGLVFNPLDPFQGLSLTTTSDKLGNLGR